MTATPTKTEVLTGDALMEVYKSNKKATATELCRLTGYYSVNKNDKVVHNIAGMQKALLIAMGVNIGSDSGSKVGPGGRKLSYIAKVQGNNNLLVGNAYTKLLGLEPGDEFQIKISKNSIRLIPVGSTEEETDA